MRLDRPKKSTDVYFILHESARFPADLFFDYMVGNLRQNLQDQEYGLPLTKEGYKRAEQVGKRLKDKNTVEIITDEFITPFETAKVINKELLSIAPICNKNRCTK